MHSNRLKAFILCVVYDRSADAHCCVRRHHEVQRAGADGSSDNRQHSRMLPRLPLGRLRGRRCSRAAGHGPCWRKAQLPDSSKPHMTDGKQTPVCNRHHTAASEADRGHGTLITECRKGALSRGL